VGEECCCSSIRRFIIHAPCGRHILAFFPYAIPATLGMIEAFWFVTLIACSCLIAAERKKSSDGQEMIVDASGNKKQ
jgi:hypothetical protein